MTTVRWNRFLRFVWPILLGGCSASQVQIWGNSDSDDPRLYTRRNPHFVHVGERVQFRVVVQPDLAAYVLMDLGQQTYGMQKTNPGEYALEWRFDRDLRDTSVPIMVRAYRQHGRPDVLIEGGRARKLSSGDDPADEVIGQAVLRVDCYQSKVVLAFKPPDGKEPDWAKAKLEIHGPENRTTVIARGSSDVEGFIPLGRDLWGNYTVFFEPTFAQVRRTGKTRVVLILPNGGKADRRFETWIDTP